jgi:hypothetical protein
MGFVVTKVHSVLSFKQEAWLKPYITKNTELRNKAKKDKDDFGIEYYKLLNNSVYGKTMENLRTRKNIKIYSKTQDKKKIQKHINNFQFAGRSMLGNAECGVIAMSEIKSKIFYNKPIIVGCAVLDLSKELMYRKFYERLQPAFGQENIRINMMDTDSFLLSIDCEGGMDEYKNKLEGLKDIINDNGILGEFKDELASKIITEIRAIRAKNYFILTEEMKDV